MRGRALLTLALACLAPASAASPAASDCRLWRTIPRGVWVGCEYRCGVSGEFSISVPRGEACPTRLRVENR